MNGRSLPASRRVAESFFRTVDAIREDAFIYLVVALHAVLVVGLLRQTGTDASLAYQPYFLVWPVVFLALFPAIFGLTGLLLLVHRFDRRRGLAVRKVVTPVRVASFLSGLALLVALMVFQGSFTSVKNALPVWQGGFAHDVAQAELDRALHFGHDPWTLLQPLLGSDIVRSAIEWNYNQGWFVVCYGTLFLVCVLPSLRPIRTRYLLTYMTVWVLIGNMLAGFFLSAGPAFYGLVTGDTARFADQLAFLARSGDSTHSAALVQHYLWMVYQSGAAGFGSGISAFPSMHVGLVTLNALFLAERSTRAGLVGLAYVGVVLASSVYLAWHYAIDGYVAIAVTVGVYWLARRIEALFRAPRHSLRSATSSMR